MLESAIHADTAAPHPHSFDPQKLTPYPNLDRLQHELAKDKAEAEFAESLANVIDRTSRTQQ